jgi:poly(A) polymerase/tRNA nucleotidyltransferase (CCA-adding enzyme)
MSKGINKKIKIPKEVTEIIESLEKAGFKTYLVGGCVRDLFLEKSPKDWDIATDAKPEDVQKIFIDSVYENNFGTVGIKTRSDEPSLKIVEVTTFRIEGGYSDSRHPDSVKFAKTVEEDLARRDFTVNALAIKLPANNSQLTADNQKEFLIDPYGGQEDLKNKLIRAVGKSEDRFNEDALRMLRAVRFACQLEFSIEKNTEKAIRENAHLLKKISKERIRDEFSKIIMTAQAEWGVRTLQNLGLMQFIIPELIEGVGVAQNKHHIYTVWEHNVLALGYSVSKGYSFEVRLASLLHDVGKPRTKQGEGSNSTFYQHEYVGAKMTRKILEDLKFPKNIVDYVTHLVKSHLFYYNVGEVTEAGVRRFLVRVGPENIDDLLKVREADRIGSGVPKAFPYKLRHLLFMIDKVKRDPISPKMLKIDGRQIMKLLAIEPSPKVGHILNALLEEVIEDPKRNSEKYLEKRAKELNELSDKELENLRKKAENAKEEFEMSAEKEIKKKHKV